MSQYEEIVVLKPQFWPFWPSHFTFPMILSFRRLSLRRVICSVHLCPTTYAKNKNQALLLCVDGVVDSLSNLIHLPACQKLSETNLVMQNLAKVGVMKWRVKNDNLFLHWDGLVACDGLRVDIQGHFSTEDSKGGPLYWEILHPLLVPHL